MDIVNLLVTLIVLLILVGLVFWAVKRLGAAFEIPAPVLTVIQVAIVVIVVLALVAMLFGGGSSFSLPTLRR